MVICICNKIIVEACFNIAAKWIGARKKRTWFVMSVITWHTARHGVPNKHSSRCSQDLALLDQLESSYFAAKKTQCRPTSAPGESGMTLSSCT